MLPSLGFNEILILGVLALVVVGPKDLPLMLRKLGRWTAKLRGMAQEFRTGFDELARQAELDELKKEVEALRRTTNLSDIRSEITKPIRTLEDYAGVSPPPAPALEGPPAVGPHLVTDDPAPEAALPGGGAEDVAADAPSAVDLSTPADEDDARAPVARSAP